MTDMTAVIQPKSDQINSDDLIAGPMTVTVTDVRVVGGTEQPVSMSIDGTSKVFRPCKSMSRVLVSAWGPDSKAYIGKSMTLYRDPKVKWGGMEVGGIRISHMSHIEKEMVLMLTMTKQNRAPHKVRPLGAAPQQAPKPASAPQPANPTVAQAAARKAAAGGTDALRAWWTGATPDQRDAAKPITVELKAIASAADAPPDDDVDEFGIPITRAIPPEIEAQIAAETRARDAMEAGE